MDILEIIKKRRSSKRLEPGHVSSELVLKAVEAGIWAANAHNSQPWRFILILDPDVKNRLLDEMGREWVEDLLADGIDRDKALRIVESSNSRSLRASCLVVVCLSMEDMDVYWDGKRARCEYIMGVQSVAAAIQNMLLVLDAMGLGACWRCSPLFAPQSVKRVLGLPCNVEPMAMVEIGLKGGETSGARKPLNEVVHINRWGERLR